MIALIGLPIIGIAIATLGWLDYRKFKRAKRCCCDPLHPHRVRS